MNERWKELVGASSQRVRNLVEEGAVRRFAEAIGDPSPLYVDAEAAARSRWGRPIAPPTFPRLFDYGELPGLSLPPSGVIHGEQGFRYRRPIFVGEELFCYAELRDAYTRRGRGGELLFLVLERAGDDALGERVFSSDDVYILTEAVAGSVQP